MDEIISSDGTMTVVFYSDKRGERRANGIVAALITASSKVKHNV